MKKLTAALEGFSKEEKLAALCDGAFLSSFEVSEEEVTDLYNSIKGE